MTDVSELSVQAIDAAGNMSPATEYTFDKLPDSATYAPKVEAESVIEDGPASRHVTNSAWSGGKAVNLTVPAGQQTTTTVPLEMSYESVGWQAELVLTDETTPGTKLTPMVNGEVFRVPDNDTGVIVSYSTVLSGGSHSMVTPIFGSLDGGAPIGSPIELGLVLECPAAGSDCVVGADVFGLKRSEGSAA